SIEFGWDNEFGRLDVFVPAFRIDSLPVRNQDWHDFLKTTNRHATLLPQSWLIRDGKTFVKSVFGPVPFDLAAGWPVQVTGEQARAYCAHHGGRLPTEAELHRAAFGDELEQDRPWGAAAGDHAAGDFGFTRWYPSPTGRHPASASKFGVEELVGNGWEWTSTPFAPLPGFAPYVRSYPGYSADFFDAEHDIVFGASWATDEVFLRPSFRNWYRRNYPYAFTSFRVVHAI
ncbi:MAG TPA: SUMF1/EgtB/PvdO family nonheme iron enzyme, partial [Polyangium sp.]|nr:SUMF1/EgtB/PvdO family nonheme iron enzyme [Polyangium sp.]